MPSDYRYDPFSDTKQPASITNELHIIPASSPFTIRLMEVPVKSSPSTLIMKVRDTLGAAITDAGATSVTVVNGSWFAVGNVITIDSEQMYVSNISGNTLTVTRGYNSTVATTHTVGSSASIESSMTEVSASPSSGQFWPDYSTGADNDINWNTGTILFNSADAGKTVVVSYNGMGSLASVNAPLNMPPWAKYRGDGSDGAFVAVGGETLSGIKQYASFTIGAGLTVNVGTDPLLILCTGAVEINGTLNGVGGQGGTNSSGAAAAGGTGTGGGATGGNYYYNDMDVFVPGNAGSGGGGGGNGNGGSIVYGGASKFDGLLTVAAAASTPSAAYQALMTQILHPFKAGAGGASGSGNTNPGGAGGGGGGTIILVGDTVANNGTLNVSGGPASTATGSNSNFEAGGGGGGAAIVIIAKSITIAGTITVQGGAGGLCKYAGTGTGGAGWYKIFEG